MPHKLAHWKPRIGEDIPLFLQVDSVFSYRINMALSQTRCLVSFEEPFWKFYIFKLLGKKVRKRNCIGVDVIQKGYFSWSSLRYWLALISQSQGGLKESSWVLRMCSGCVKTSWGWVVLSIATCLYGVQYEEIRLSMEMFFCSGKLWMRWKAKTKTRRRLGDWREKISYLVHQLPLNWWNVVF